MAKPVKADSLASSTPLFSPLPNPFVNGAIDKVVKPVLNGCHSSPPARPIIKKVALNDRPTSPPPPPPAAAASSSDEQISSTPGSDLVYFKFTPTGPVRVPLPLNMGTDPFDPAKLQALIKQAETADGEGKQAEAFGHYFEAFHHLNFSILDSNGLLMKALCLLKLCKFFRANGKDDKDYIEAALKTLDQLEEKLFKANAKEKTDPIFMYSLGSVYLALGCYGLNPTHNQRAKNYFLGALKLTPPPGQDGKILKHKILLGLGVSYLYQVRKEIINAGTEKKERLQSFLESSRTHLNQALELHTDPTVQYLLALNHGFTTLLLNEKYAYERKESNKETLYEEAEDRLAQAIEILAAIPNKTHEILALYGCLKYQDAFDQLNIDYEGAWEAFRALSEALPYLGDDAAVPISVGDAARQLAWVSPNFQCQAEEYLNRAVQLGNPDNALSGSNQLIFFIQRAFWIISETNQKLLDSKKPSPPLEVKLEDLQKKSIECGASMRRRAILQDLKNQSRQDRWEHSLQNLRRLEDLKKKVIEDLNIAEAHQKKDRFDPIFHSFIGGFKEDLKTVEILRKTALLELRAKTIAELKTYAKELHALTEKRSNDTFFVNLRHRISDCIEPLITDLDLFPPTCDSQEELRGFNKFAWNLGEKLDPIFVRTLFKYMLMERFRHLDFVLDLEIPRS